MILLDAPILHVTVFVNRARITRRGTKSLEAGQHLLVVDTLPDTLENDSVRASGRGSGITLLGVDVKTIYVTEAPQQEIAEFESQLEILQRTMQAWKDDESTIAARLNVIDVFAKNTPLKLARTFGGSGTSVDNVTELNAYIAQQMRDLHAARRHNTQQQNDLKKRIEATEIYLRSLHTSQQPQKRQIHVSVRADIATEFDLEVTYSVTGASWQPLYDVRLREGNDVALTYLANVIQKTGENWHDVAMSLSTARPAVSTALPVLPTAFISAVQLRVRQEMKMQRSERDSTKFREMKKKSELYSEMTAESPPPKPQAAIAQSTISTAGMGASITYQIGAPVTVPSDGSPHKTSVAIPTLSAKLDYVTAPKIASEAYLRAKITNTSAYTLLPGQVSIFHADDYVGKTEIGLIAPNEEFNVQLGVENRIKVERELTHREVSKSFIGLARLIGFTYCITITNLLPTSATISVIDQIPVSRDATVKVTHDVIQPKPTEATDLDILTWTFDLAPNAKQIITFGFTVEHNRNSQVVGLPDDD